MDIIESNLNGYFFDINALITTNSKVWIIDKLKPNEPILKIAKSEFNAAYHLDQVRNVVI